MLLATVPPSSVLVVLGSDIVHLLRGSNPGGSRRLSVEEMERVVPPYFRYRLETGAFVYTFTGLRLYLHSLADIQRAPLVDEFLTASLLPLLEAGVQTQRRMTDEQNDSFLQSLGALVIHDDDKDESPSTEEEGDDEDDLYCYETLDVEDLIKCNHRRPESATPGVSPRCGPSDHFELDSNSPVAFDNMLPENHSMLWRMHESFAHTTTDGENSGSLSRYFSSGTSCG
jgi:hypothetical protein